MAGFLIVQRGPDIGRRVNLNKAITTVGRDADNDMTLDDPYVSRYHAVFREQPDGTMGVIDLGSENPVAIRDVPLEAGEPHILQHRDMVRVGQTVFSYQIPSAKAPAPQPRPDQTRNATGQFVPPPAESAPPPDANWGQSSYGRFGSDTLNSPLVAAPPVDVSSARYDSSVPTVKTSDAPKEVFASAPSAPDNDAPTQTGNETLAGLRPPTPDSPDYNDFGNANTAFIPAIKRQPDQQN